ncbi:type II toxin-antitoxin system RelE/ParE family toxin [Fulvivirga sp.]|uniref:type II toxin-antitoxin system RelE/ParE family toxin n=1 Tax=Fulvivirga sp. TaxID=1931237 RepID=UPI0032EC4D3B
MPSKKNTIKWTPFALSCLDEIYEYVRFKEKFHPPAAKLVNTIFDKVEQLTAFSESG